MPEPSLSEINSFRPDPEVATGTPATVIDHANTVRLLNENARAKQANDMDRYNTFMSNLSDVYQKGFDVASTEVRAEDKDKLKENIGKIFSDISKDPKNFFSRQGMNDTYGKLSSLKADAEKSKAANVFTQSTREFLNLNPSFQNGKNEKLVKDSESAPLETWKPFQLDYTPHVDLGALSTELNKNYTKPYTKISDDKQYIVSGKRTAYDDFQKGWDNYIVDPQRADAAKEQYGDAYLKRLPAEEQAKYRTKDGSIDFPKLWHKIGKDVFVTGEDPKNAERKLDYETVEKQVPNKFALQDQASQNKRAENEDKFKNTAFIEKLKGGYKIGVAQIGAAARKYAADKTLEGKKVGMTGMSNWLQSSADAIIDEAKDNGEDIFGNGYQAKVLPIDNSVLNGFSIKIGTTSIPPSKAAVDENGNIRLLFTDDKGNIDEAKTKIISEETFKANYGKQILGQKGVSLALSGNELDLPTPKSEQKPKPKTVLQKVAEKVLGKKKEPETDWSKYKRN